ncbi:NADP-dependent oxidoreductase [Neptunomonas phycophila]|uniref:NADP-dependent oxidoreductase n=1 Tax=Neptunomonas phycophila TaxID=1572645 RepID=A0ABT9EV38_9GAMM|nr:NADP-dependent oxidoreductase [Neptunomonas phycophila]MDP2522871.1 NADP-dependent oxidoreductase [Neptunomonas phycophila]
MKAIRLDQFSEVDTFATHLTVQEIPEPALEAGEVLIRTLAAGVNPIDYKTCSGGGASAFIGDLPFIPGWEFAGEVIACGSDVTGFDSGDAVVGFIRFPERAGCYAERIAAPADQIARLPKGVAPITAAGAALAGLTAWQALFDKGNLQPQQRVLVMAAAGGVGHLAVQLAKWKGAHVVGTASPANHDHLLALGCDQAIDYRDELALEAQAPFDLIIDGVGGETGIKAIALLAATGTLITLPSVTKDQVIAAAEKEGKKALPIRVEPNGQQLAELLARIEQQELTVTVAETYPLAEVARAFTQIATGHTRGKVVLTLGS